MLQLHYFWWIFSGIKVLVFFITFHTGKLAEKCISFSLFFKPKKSWWTNSCCPVNFKSSYLFQAVSADIANVIVRRIWYRLNAEHYPNVLEKLVFFNNFFSCYLAAPWQNLSHSQGGSLTNSMFITAFLTISTWRSLWAL